MKLNQLITVFSSTWICAVTSCTDGQLDAPVVEEVGELRQCLSRLFKEAATSEADSVSAVLRRADGVSAVLRRAAPSLVNADTVEGLLLHHRVAFRARHTLCQQAVLTHPLSAGVLIGGRQMKVSLKSPSSSL